MPGAGKSSRFRGDSSRPKRTGLRRLENRGPSAQAHQTAPWQARPLCASSLFASSLCASPLCTSPLCANPLCTSPLCASNLCKKKSRIRHFTGSLRDFPFHSDYSAKPLSIRLLTDRSYQPAPGSLSPAVLPSQPPLRPPGPAWPPQPSVPPASVCGTASAASQEPVSA